MFCPRCAAQMNWIEYEGRMRDVCPDCGWVNYRHLKVSAGVMVEDDCGRLLLARRTQPPWQGMWNLPTGYVEADETPEEAAAREALEETGLIVEPRQLAGVYTYHDDPRGSGLVIFYRASIRGGIPQTTDETSELRYFARQEVKTLEIAGAGQLDAIVDWANGQEGA